MFCVFGIEMIEMFNFGCSPNMPHIFIRHHMTMGTNPQTRPQSDLHLPVQVTGGSPGRTRRACQPYIERNRFAVQSRKKNTSKIWSSSLSIVVCRKKGLAERFFGSLFTTRWTMVDSLGSPKTGESMGIPLAPSVPLTLARRAWILTRHPWKAVGLAS